MQIHPSISTKFISHKHQHLLVAANCRTEPKQSKGGRLHIVNCGNRVVNRRPRGLQRRLSGDGDVRCDARGVKEHASGFCFEKKNAVKQNYWKTVAAVQNFWDFRCTVDNTNKYWYFFSLVKEFRWQEWAVTYWSFEKTLMFISDEKLASQKYRTLI